MSRSLILFAVLGLTLSSCASSSNSAEDATKPAPEDKTTVQEDGPEDWKPMFHEQTPDFEPLQEAEAEAVEYFAISGLALHSLSWGRMDLLKKQLVSKGERQKQVEKLFFRAIEADGMKDSGKTHAAFRISQMYFDFACQLRALRMPEGLHELEKAQYATVLHQDFIAPLLVKSRQAFSTTAKFGAQPWRTKAESLVDVIPEKGQSMTPAQVATICRDYRRVWASPAALLRADRALASSAPERSKGAEIDVEDSDVKEDEAQAPDESGIEAEDDEERELIVGRGSGSAIVEPGDVVEWEPMPLGFDVEEPPDDASTGEE